MAARAGDLEFLDHPVAQYLLSSTEPAQLGYIWMDGTPRTIPIWFHWDGEAIFFATRPRAQKLIALRAKPEVAISIDEHVLPYKILYLRGVASIELLDNAPPEYAAAAERYLGLEQGRAYVDRLRGQRFARIRVPPTWANVIDFETRFPSALAD